jgi:PAS domain S-box-containing protein
MDVTNDALWDWNMVTNEVYRNPRYARMLEYEPQDIPSSQDVWEKQIHPDDKQTVFDCLRAHLNGENQCFALEYRLRTKSGDYLWILDRGKVVTYDNAGKPIRMIGTSIDISERKQLEGELRQQSEKLENLVAERTAELAIRNKSLEEMNTALNVLLQKRDEDKRKMEEIIVSNFKSLVYPYLEKMQNDSSDNKQHLLFSIMDTHLDELLSPFMNNLQQFNLTPKELQVAAMVKDGKTTKEIAAILGVEVSSIDYHRHNIRKKLGLSRSVNFQLKLQSLK